MGPECMLDTSKLIAFGYSGCIFPSREEGEEQLAAFLFHNGPLGAGIASTVFESCDDEHWVTDCSSTAIDHAVTAVGFSNHPSRGRYWIIKNSWGDYWQAQGFVYLPFGISCGAFPNGVAEMV